MKTQIGVLSLLMKRYCVDQFEIVKWRSTCPSTAFRKSGLVFMSGRWSTTTGQGICQKEGFDGKQTNQSLQVAEAARISDETLMNN